MPNLHKKEYNCLVLHAKYLKLRLEINADILIDANKEFMEEYFEICKTVPEEEKTILENAAHGVRKAAEAKSETPENEEVEERMEQTSKKDNPESVKRVYKEIAKRTHPDAVLDLEDKEREERTELFHRAQRAVDDLDILELLDVAGELDVSFDKDDIEYTEMLRRNIQTFKTLEFVETL